ncbi:hypothetical protein L7Q78_17845 [Achromobacter xylosoxidans]|nr:hypothetical protein [Achromobacter xylosoxidans]
MDRAHDGLAWIVIAATFAKVVRPEDAALKLHGLAQKYCMDIQFKQS